MRERPLSDLAHAQEFPPRGALRPLAVGATGCRADQIYQSQVLLQKLRAEPERAPNGSGSPIGCGLPVQAVDPASNQSCSPLDIRGRPLDVLDEEFGR